MIEATFAALDPDYDARVRASFARQGAMKLLGATIGELEPGHCSIELVYRDELAQQHGYFHAGITSAVADSAGGYAALTLFPATAEVLTVEFKINLIAPARGDRLVADGPRRALGPNAYDLHRRRVVRARRRAHSVRDHAADAHPHRRKVTNGFTLLTGFSFSAARSHFPGLLA